MKLKIIDSQPPRTNKCMYMVLNYHFVKRYGNGIKLTIERKKAVDEMQQNLMETKHAYFKHALVKHAVSKHAYIKHASQKHA